PLLDGRVLPRQRHQRVREHPRRGGRANPRTRRQPRRHRPSSLARQAPPNRGGREDRMRDNRVKQTLAAGGVSVATMRIELNTTGIARIAAEAGAEFAVFDMEHSGWGMEEVRMLMAT